MDTYPVDFVSVDSKAWVRDPGWASPVTESAMNNENSQERHPKRSTNPPETPALDRDLAVNTVVFCRFCTKPNHVPS